MQLDFVLPGLFDRLEAWSRDYAAIPSFPTLDKCLSVADTRYHLARGFEATLWQQYDPTWQPADELPSAGMLSGILDGTVFHATPVHLEAGLRDLILNSTVPLTNTEAAELAWEIDTHLQGSDVSYHLDEDGNASLVFEQAIQVHTTPPSEVAGRGVFRYLPEGDGAARLRQLSNELQMLLHAMPFNQRRERQGKITANGLWLWGGGTPGQSLQPAHDLLIGSHPFAQRCASISGQAHKLLPERFDGGQLKDTRHALIVHDGLLPDAERDDIHGWQQTLTAIEQDWIEPMLAALRTGTLQRLTLIPCNGKAFSLSPCSHWKIWRRPKTLCQLT